MHPVSRHPVPRIPLDGITRNWTCRLCSHSNPDDEDICCQQCGGVKR
ncbi:MULTISPECIES: hypothetical protein [Nocardiopsis]|uniref:RanBP2-type domain-containing protein n=2 Tax=Nocardiopsis alba TaxID=53437 RepID=A0ABV5E1H8_9ACTN|nr:MULTISPECIES: hypothetical protein [Nocardiopsis]AFR08955.1 hypothetical protein B005_0046 [Nocardiopsis alba ATCC BAA-2165]MEC3895572.1 hypothetical protein [Nocardiopsis sp. LDBS1602]